MVDAVLGALEEELRRSDDPGGWTLEDVARRAGVGIGSFYEYFANRDSLVAILIGRLTERNFKNLLAEIDGREHATLEDIVAHTAAAIARTYLDSPTFMRVVMSGIGRLCLMTPVVHERDRFAEELAVRARPFLPHASQAELAATMRLIADAVMGIIGAELIRTPRPDVEACRRDLDTVALVLLRARHPIL